MGRKLVALWMVCIACGGVVDPGHDTQPQPGPTPGPVYTPPPSGPIVNGGFESGTLSGWTALGPVALESFDTDSGKFAARLGPGEASLSQSFQAPYGMQLVVWYDDACSGNGAASASVRDQATGATAVALPATCDAAPAWRSATLDLSGMGGDPVTFSLINHDNGSGTFTFFDDVSLQYPPPPDTGPGPSTTECVFDSDCNADYVCSAGSCQYSPPATDACAFDTDCSAGDVCSAGACVAGPPADECGDDFDCGGDQVCDGGSCVEPDPGPGCGSAPRPGKVGYAAKRASVG